MQSKKEQREQKEVKTRKYKQQIENLKLDLIELQEKNELQFKEHEVQKNIMVSFLSKAVNFTKSKLKYDINNFLQKEEK